MLQELYNICQEFKNTSGKNDKKSLLKRESQNILFKQYIKYVLDPLATYGLQDKKIKKFLGKNTDKSIGNKTLFDIFEYLEKHPTGTDKDAEIVARFIDAHEDKEIKDFILESVTKKMKLGISEKTVNEVWGKGFLNQFEVMLAKKYEDEQHKIEGKEFVLTEKYDGVRAVFIKKNNNIKCFSRQGQLITGLTEIEKEIAQLPDAVYDGELLIKDYTKYKDRNVLQETLKITRKDGEKTGVNFMLFDVISNEDFEEGKSKENYLQRRAFLSNHVLSHQFENVHLIPILYRGKELDVIPDLLAQLEAQGKEGLMLNIVDAPYECKRSSNILKLKTMLTADLQVIGFEKGKPLGKYENTLGTLIVDYKGYPLGVSGFSDEMRDEIWNNKSKYLGAIAEVQYFRESQNEQGGLSVSFPQFKGWRWDKNEPSYN